ncbi:MAG: hypothetical protein HWQ41_06100 [Nostoc sp. NOS(2021)]|uniref:hypothetical protein n=1 Tax=Nostoc sp. NOS(2021) TaxID=2815407 RepID=UPI0025DA1D47|nr:hypothetical protein [Nostoc sp. NOS(2021)]MBN3894838.1 hypothetical protein [Nostoc sp. NOS(2021)]
MTRRATVDDLMSGKLIFYWADQYQVWWLSDTHVCLCLPGCRPNAWIAPYPAGTYTKPTSWILPINHPGMMVFE